VVCREACTEESGTINIGTDEQKQYTEAIMRGYVSPCHSFAGGGTASRDLLATLAGMESVPTALG